MADALATRVPRELRVDANGVAFGALQWGADRAPLALLLHGFPDTAWTWRHLGPYLAERGWRAVAPFSRGYAPTALAPDDRYGVADLGRDACALHAALGGDERAVLVGHDWGAVATWAVTASDPDRFDRYVAMAVPPPAALVATASPRLVPRQLRLSWYIGFNQVPGAERQFGRVVPKLWRTWSPGYDPSEDLRRFFAALPTLAHRRAALEYYRDGFRRRVTEMFSVEAGAPALYLHGERDGCLQAAIGERAIAALPSGSRFAKVPGVGHFLQLEDPERVNSLIGDWLGTPV
jgi:pimeloyl-ACP methyl ester carboxylesterase